ncbi:translation initiation factor eIF-1A [Candidatus Woesearchaeota archaeon]|mgnify:CR=1 FL=1|jgi:translation initiation factor 1A|nr:translation initiation factor eIF-1A [Candidatus Woesearchaeota archaeon]MBT4114625.1 translation initiation factor eIF-1A [Candidatus Woesearchaeota archaeon]MBT4248491.1 translation initiation factor eIF-1A [Candidatus Woesearchaeota archaeon]
MERKKKFKKQGRHAYQKKKAFGEEGEVLRVKTPKGREVLGVVDIRLGMGKSRIKCFDSKERICKVPGAKKRRLWVRSGDTVIVEPWEFGGDEKGNIVYKYRPVEVAWLRKKGLLKEIEDIEEF